jgi:hypothetical protein
MNSLILGLALLFPGQCANGRCTVRPPAQVKVMPRVAQVPQVQGPIVRHSKPHFRKEWQRVYPKGRWRLHYVPVR